MSESARLRPVEPDEALERLLRLTRETLTDETWPAREGELRRLQDRLGTTRPRIRWSLISALSALAVMLPAAWLVLKQPSALTFEVIHGTVAAGGEIRPLDVWLHKGSVTVRGPMIDGGVVMTRGQHLLMRIRDNKIVLDKNGLEAAATARPAGSGTLVARDDEVDEDLDAPEEPSSAAE